MPKMKRFVSKIAVFFTVVFMFLPATSFASSNINVDKDYNLDDFKVIGYYCGEWFDVPVEKLQADKLTHIMYGFLIPTEEGTCKGFEEPDEIVKLVEKCHSVGTKVFVSIGGYRDKSGTPLYPIFEKIGADEQLKNKFVDNVMEVVKQYDFDGVELDWEYPKYSTSDDYEKTVILLSERLKVMGKGLSTALPGTGSTDGKNVWEALAGVTDKTIEHFDFISLMCYDLKTDTNHSPIWFSDTTINYWEKFRNVPSEKIVLGMPLYARPSWQQYRFLVDMDKENAYKDYVSTEPLESTYNGLNTLREKTMLALRKAGGIMLFDVNEDTYDETSVVSMINQTISMMDGLDSEKINNYIWVVVDNKPLLFNLEDGMGMPYIDSNNRTLIPIRKLLESIGAEVNYFSNEDTDTDIVVANLNGTTMKLIIGSNKYSVNGVNLEMDTVAVVKNGRTYIPARTVLETFDYDVSYSNISKCVYANSNHK